MEPLVQTTPAPPARPWRIALLPALLLAGCQPAPAPPPPGTPAKAEPVVVDLPADLMKDRPGRLMGEGKAYIYFRSLNLLWMVHEWNTRMVLRNTADLLGALSADPRLAAEADWWTVQTDREYDMEDFRRLVMTVTPAQAKAYAADRNLEALLLGAVFVKYNDIPYSLSAEERLALLAGREVTAQQPYPRAPAGTPPAVP